MCLIAWVWEPGRANPLLIAGNRDEYHARPTAPLQWWEGERILAGRDLQGGGTWMGIGRGGRFAALTNYRDPTHFQKEAPSRGTVVSGFLEGTMSSDHYLQSLLLRASRFNPFNLLVFDGIRLMGLESRHHRIISLEPGLGAVSNADFNGSWPKVTRLKDTLRTLQDHEETEQDEVIWRSLSDRQIAPDSHLPHTGIPLAMERVLSSAFIATPDYGTRASTLIRLKSQGGVMKERRFSPTGAYETTTVCF